ncbi:MAG: extracellular solute-binding protein, partial [Armatimonadetes bacterium]|nr:extracellular solute-binding protein [Armatimonadota bacterium]
LIDTLFRAQKPGEELGYQVVDKGDQNNDFANEKCAFFFRSSTARPSIQKLVGRKFEWNMGGLPSAPGAEPVTVMFGGNICIFKSSPEREKTAWEFIRFFAPTPITARWANVTGYLPVTRSAAKEQVMVDFFAAAPQNRAAFDLLTVARPEPNVAGWQAVRKCLEDAETALVTQLKTPAEVGAELQQCAGTALTGAR